MTAQKPYIIFVSEVATLSGCNRFEEPQKVASKILDGTRFSNTTSFAREREFVVKDKHFLLRGKIAPEKDGLPVLIRVRKEMQKRMYDNDYAQCQALCFLYDAKACIFTERPEFGSANPYTVQIEANQEQWNMLKQKMYDNLRKPCASASSWSGPDFDPRWCSLTEEEDDSPCAR